MINMATMGRAVRLENMLHSEKCKLRKSYSMAWVMSTQSVGGRGTHCTTSTRRTARHEAPIQQARSGTAQYKNPIQRLCHSAHQPPNGTRTRRGMQCSTHAKHPDRLLHAPAMCELS